MEKERKKGRERVVRQGRGGGNRLYQKRRKEGVREGRQGCQ